MKDDNLKMTSIEELRALCDMTVEQTRLRQNQCKHLSIDIFAPQLLDKLIRERDEITFPPTRSEPLPLIERYRDKNTGVIYEVICNATLANDGALMVVYRNAETGERWIMASDEFVGGKFERVD